MPNSAKTHWGCHVKLIKVGAGVLNQTPLDWDGNRERILAAIREAQRQQVSVLCLPELCITGYGCEDAFYSVGVQQMAQQVLLEIVPETSEPDRLAGAASVSSRRVVQHGLFVGRRSHPGIRRQAESGPRGAALRASLVPAVAGQCGRRHGRRRPSVSRWATWSLTAATCVWVLRSAKTPGWPIGPEVNWPCRASICC